jgi:hypothetical protein
MVGEKKEQIMVCLICTQLERSLTSACEPDPPNLLLGLTQAGKRNRDHQKREKILRIEADLARHKKSCSNGSFDQKD